jgi:hypothetical protein
MPIISALLKIARYHLAHGRRARKLPRDFTISMVVMPMQVAIGRVDRNDRKIGRQCVGAVGAFGDRQAQEHAVGEKRNEADGHAVGPRAAEQVACAQKAEDEVQRRARVERQQQRGVEISPQIERGNPVNRRQGIANFWVKVINPSTALAGNSPRHAARYPAPVTRKTGRTTVRMFSMGCRQTS